MINWVKLDFSISNFFLLEIPTCQIVFSFYKRPINKLPILFFFPREDFFNIFIFLKCVVSVIQDTFYKAIDSTDIIAYWFCRTLAQCGVYIIFFVFAWKHLLIKTNIFEICHHSEMTNFSKFIIKRNICIRWICQLCNRMAYYTYVRNILEFNIKIVDTLTFLFLIFLI